MSADEFNGAVSLVLQELEKSFEQSLVILPAPGPVPDDINLDQVSQKIRPQRDPEYIGSLDMEEKGQEIQANEPLGQRQ